MWNELRKNEKKISLVKLNDQSWIENHCSVETYIKNKAINFT